MPTAGGSWREADRADREKYAQQPSRFCAHQADAGPARDAGPAERDVASQPPPGTLYSALGVQRGATATEIKRAYRRLLVAAHPDKGGDRRAFEELQAAYAVLSDPTERLIYDEKLERELGGSANGGGAAAAGAGGNGLQVQRGAAGVTAVVHGQTQGSPQQQQGLQPPRCRRQEAGNAEQLAAATAAIAELSADGGDAAGLAAAHLHRAFLHRAAGQLHHALFDAEEAARLDPGLGEAAALAEELGTAAEEQQAEAGRRQGEVDEEESGSDGEAEPF